GAQERMKIRLGENLPRQVFMRIEDHALTGALQHERHRQEFGIVKVIDVGVERPGPRKNPPRRMQHALQATRRLAYIKDSDTITYVIPLPVRDDQGDLIACRGKTTALLQKYARIAAGMHGGEMGDLCHLFTSLSDVPTL